ncbi:hypothetical protein FQN49_001220 [Arthroderma sp. PD_2]|nr:hypothetical protein FQN49_001220 [Arthroderma sp. PD_2]
MPHTFLSDKKSATKYQLFHRSQHDPLIHDPEAEDRVLHVVGGPAPAPSTTSSSSKRETGTLRDLEEEFKSATRKNEGEAANYGIFYDDTKYDYMQHLRGLGEGVGDTHFVEAKTKGKGKKGMKLEDALKEISLDGDRQDGSIYGGDDFLSTASSYVRRATYQDQQDVPDAIAGFQPDMDPRLRETLEALEDDAYVDGDCEDDIFDDLVSGGHDAEVDPDEWRDTYIEDEDEGWESDETEKAPVQHNKSTSSQASEILDSSSGSIKTSQPPNDDQIPDTEEHEGDWLRDFAKYKKDVKGNKGAVAGGDESASELRTTASTLFTLGGTPIRKKKRKGAQTNPSAYSMTSSSLARTDGHRLLDDRFERVEALYALDEEGEEYEGASMADDMSVASGLSRFSRFSKLSQAPSLVPQDGNVALRSDFNEVMDGFLDKWDDRRVHAKRKGAQGRRGKNGNEVIGIKMLDEVRQGLGPPRLSTNAFGKV